MKQLLSTLTVILAILGANIVSAYVFANVVEKVFLFDLPYIESVAKTDVPTTIYQVNEKTVFNSNIEKYGFYGQPKTLRIPRINYALNVQEVSEENGFWLASNGVASIHFFAKSQGGHLGNAVIFGLQGAKTLDFTALINEGDRVVVDTTTGWRHNYRVSKRIINKADEKYLVDSNGQSKIVFVKRLSDQKTVIVEATYMSVEELSQI